MLSLNGKCPVCGNLLTSPKEVMSFDRSAEEFYKEESAPKITDAVISLYIEPLRAVKKLKYHSSLLRGFMNVSLLYLIATAFRILVMLAVLFLLRLPEVMLQPSTLFSLLITTIYGFGIAVISWLVSSAILYLPAKMLGGKGTFVEQACLLSYVALALAPFYIFAAILITIPYFGFILSLIGFVIISLYGIFLTLVTIKEIHSFNPLIAVLSFSISFLIHILLTIISAVLLIFLITGKLPSL
ncbi:MAG: Yip1 family protein [Candidatus Micrarchaeia archaeon]